MSSESGAHAERPLRVCGFDPTTGLSIRVNTGTVALLYTLHDTFDPLTGDLAKSGARTPN